VGVFATYVNGRVGGDRVGLSIWRGGTQISTCSDITIAYANGNVSCTFKGINAGSYDVEVAVNGQVMARHPFTVGSTTALALTGLTIARRIENGQPIEPTGHFDGGPTSVGVVAPYVNGRVGDDRVGLSLWSGGTRISTCSDLTIAYANGTVSCTFNGVGTGSYNVRVAVNGQLIDTVGAFTVGSAREQIPVSDAPAPPPPPGYSSAPPPPPPPPPAQ
jgi:hypothetical protein